MNDDKHQILRALAFYTVTNEFDIPPKITDARYAKGQKLVQCESLSGYKTRAARLAEHVKGRYSNREKGYVMSAAKVGKLVILYMAGRDASSITGQLYEERPLP